MYWVSVTVEVRFHCFAGPNQYWLWFLLPAYCKTITEFKHGKDATLSTMDLYRPRFGVYKYSPMTLAISNKTDTDPVLSVRVTVCCKHALSISS